MILLNGGIEVKETMESKKLKSVTSMAQLTIEEGFILRERAFYVIDFCKSRDCLTYWWHCPKLCDDAKALLTTTDEVSKVLRKHPIPPREKDSVYAGKGLDYIVTGGGYIDSGFDPDYYSDSEIDTQTFEQKDQQRLQSETRIQEENDDEWWKSQFATGPALTIGDIVQLVESFKLTDKEWATIMTCKDLSIRQLQILHDRYWTQRTMIQIAKELKVSRERARVVLRQALSILLPQLWILHKKRLQKKRAEVGENGYERKSISRYRRAYKTKEK